MEIAHANLAECTQNGIYVEVDILDVGAFFPSITVVLSMHANLGASHTEAPVDPSP